MRSHGPLLAETRRAHRGERRWLHRTHRDGIAALADPTGPAEEDVTREMDAYLELCTVGDLVVRGRAHRPEQDAVVFPEARRTYRELEQRATTVARSLHGMGLAPGDRVGVFMPNRPEFLEILFGALFLGAVVVPVNARFRHRELRHVIGDAEMRVLFVGDAPGDPTRRADVVSEALGPVDRAGTFAAGEVARLHADAAPRLEAVVTLDPAEAPGFLSDQAFSRLARDATGEAVHARRRRVAVRDVALMFYTSGTTSMPKGCLLSHEALVRTGICTRERLGYRDGDRVFAPCPMFHTASTQPMIAAMHALGTMVTMGHFEPEGALALVENEGVTAMFPAFPALTEGMLGSPHYRTESFRRVRTVFTVAPTPALRSMQHRMPHTRLVNAYGMTEFGGSVVMVSPEDEDDVRLGTQGPPFPGIEIGIRDESNADLGTGRRGEIVVRGPSMFAEYHRDPAKTAECIDADGWFHTGDLGALGEDGRLRFQGRLKDMLKIGGENVAAIEIASCLQELAQVSEAHVVGIADAKYGEVPAAFIALHPGATLTEQDAIEHCVAQLARFKVPRYVRFVTEWPMSSTKVQTARLREQLETELRAGSTMAP